MVSASAHFRAADRGPIAVLQRFFFCGVVALLAWLPASSFASFPPVSTAGYSFFTTFQTTVAAACAVYPGWVVYTPSPTACGFPDGLGGWNNVIFPTPGNRVLCPSNSSGTEICTCNAGFMEDASHTSCVPIPVPSSCGFVHDSTLVLNVTSGYMRSPGGAEYPAFKPDGSPAPIGYAGLAPATICYDGCQGSRAGVVASWSSSEPTATGLYRVSDDWEFKFANTSCQVTASDKALLDQTFTAPPCNGFLGSVNGKPTCVAMVPDVSSGSAKVTKVGNPTAGTIGGGGVAGNIPTGGNGANGGGPATSKDGSVRLTDGSIVSITPTAVPTGTTAAPPAGEQQAACGAPGQPKCAMDETGTPTGKTDYGQEPIAAANKSLDDTLAGIQSTTGKDTSWGLVPRWLQQSGGCSPTVLYTLPSKLGSMPISIDLCPHLPLIYTLMNLLWVVWTFGAIVSMVFRVTSAGGG